MLNMTYVALLRGINVGGKNKVAMLQLKACFEAHGFSNVATYINTGNVIFTSDQTDQSQLVQTIEHAIEKQFGFAVRVVVRDESNIELVVGKIPKAWVNDAEQKTDVMFMWPEVDSQDVLRQVVIKTDVDTVRYVAGAILWNIERMNASRSGMQKFIGTKLYKHVTIRNANTVRKLHYLMKRE